MDDSPVAGEIKGRPQPTLKSVFDELGPRADQHRESDRRVAVNADLRCPWQYLAPGLSLFEGAAAQSSPMWRIGGDLYGIAVPGELAWHEDGRLLDEVLGRATAEIDHPSLRGRIDNLRQLQRISDHVEENHFAVLET